MLNADLNFLHINSSSQTVYHILFFSQFGVIY